jgi:hypothetical protein
MSDLRRAAQGAETDSQPRGLAALVADDTTFWRVATYLFATISILKGLHTPSLWAATQANLDYRYGFIKRGMFGQIARMLGLHIAHYDAFVLLSGVLLLLAIVLIGWWTCRSGARRLAGGAVVAALGASYMVTYLVHLIGYLEIPMAMLALLGLAISASSGRLIAVLLLSCLGVLIHESYLVAFLPTTLLPALLAALEQRDNRWRALAPIAVVAGVVVVLVLAVALGAPMTAERAAALQANMTAEADFAPRMDFFPVLTRSAADNVAVMARTMTLGKWWLAQCNALLTFMPTAAFFLWVACDIIKARQAGARRFMLQAVVLVAGLCPLCMQLLGWDIYRWYALAAFNSFLALTVVCHRYGAPLSGNIRAGRNIAILLIGINLATGTGLFDGRRVDTFPFVDFWWAVIHWIGAGGHFAPPVA